MMISVWVAAAWAVAAALTAGVIVWLALPEAEQPRRRERRAEYEHPDFADAAGFAVTAYPESDIILRKRVWLIEDEVAELDYTIVPGRSARLRVARQGQMRHPDGFDPHAFESVAQYQIDGVPVTHYQSAGQRGMLTWSRDGFECLLYAEDPEMNMLSGLAVVFVGTVRAEQR